MNTYSQESAPRSATTLPRHFSSLEAYEEWRKDILETVENVKRDLYPGSDGNYDLLEEPPSFLFFSLFSWRRRIQYYITFFLPPILLQPDRLLLENKSAQIKQYIKLTDLHIKKYMMIDYGHMVQVFALMEKAREKLRAKYPDYPLEYQDLPVNPLNGLIIYFLSLAGLLFPNFLEALSKLIGTHWSVIFIYIPSVIVPTYSKVATVSLKPVQTEIFLSYYFYLTFVIAILAYKCPPISIKYDIKNTYFIFTFTVSVAIFVTTYLFPGILVQVFINATYRSPTIIGLVVLSAACIGDFLGITAFKCKQRLAPTDQPK